MPLTAGSAFSSDAVMIVQNPIVTTINFLHTLEDALNDALRETRGGPEAYDGVAELWWESREDLAAAIATPEGQRAGEELLDDERRFIDLARSPLWLAEEHPIVAETR